MADGKLTIAVPLAGGVDTKTDAKVVLPNKMLAMENKDFTKGGSVRDRKGYVNVPAHDVTGALITDAMSVAPLNDGWVLLTRTKAYTLDRAKNSWASLGPYSPMTHEEHEVASMTRAQAQPDIDSTNGVTCVVWQEGSTLEVHCQVIDDASGSVLVADQLLATNAYRAHVTAVGSNLLITWFDDATDSVKCRVVKTTDVSGSIGSADITLFADANNDGFYDVTRGADCMYLLVHQDAAVSDRVRLFKVNSSGTVNYSVTASSAASAGHLTLAWNQLTNKLFIAWIDNAVDVGKVKLQRYAGSDLILELSFTEAAASTPVAIALSPRTDGGVTRWQWGSAGGNQAFIIPHDAALAQGTTITLRHSALAGAGWYDGVAGYNFIALVNSATGIQDTFFMYRDDGVLLGRILPGSAVVDTSPRLKDVGDGKFQTALAFKRQVRVNLDKITGATLKQTPVFSHQGIQKCVFDTNPAVHAVQVDNVLYTSGSFMWAVDGGGAPTEAQFLLFPDQVASNIVWGAGGSLTNGATYHYRVYYEWTNARGQRVRSLALTLTSTATNNKATLTLRTLTHTLMQSRSPVAIVVYRSAANQETFYYRVSSSNPLATGDNGYVANTTGAFTVSFADAMSDATAEQKELDYVSFGETDHFAFDAPAVVATVGNRVFCGGGGQFPDRPQFSLLRQDGRPVETNDTWVITEFPEYGGRLMGFSDLNGVPVVFKERAIYRVFGGGPTNQRGAVNDYQAQALSTDVGCTEVPSLVRTPGGVFFKSAKGIYLLDPSGELRYIGREVERYNSQRITGAAVVPDTNMVLFLTDAGVTLMYDYGYGEWGVYTNHEGLACAVTNTDFAYLRNDGQLYIRDNDVYTDAGIPYETYFRTAPLHLEDTVQGFHKLSKFQCLGTYAGPHLLDIELFYNREANPYQTLTFDPSVELDLDPWGDSEIWGDASEVWGGALDGQDYNFEGKPKRSKFSSISFGFRGRPGTPPGATFEMTELLLRVKTRGGAARLPARRHL